MNDEFLNQQQPPRPEFTAALYQRINTPMKTSSPLRRFVPGIALLALILTLVFSASVRAYAQEIFTQIGQWLISDEPTYAEQFETQINLETPTVHSTADPIPLEWQAPPLLTLAEATAEAGFPVFEMTALPENLQLVARFVTLPDEENPFTRVTTTYHSSTANLVLSQTSYLPDASPQTLPIGESPTQPITVQEVSGLWIEALRLSTYVDDNNQVAPQFANLLIWEKDGFEFWLQSTPGLPQADMLAIANAIEP